MKEHKMMKKDGIMSNKNEGIHRKMQKAGDMETGQGGKMGNRGEMRKGEFKPKNDGPMKYVP